MTNIIELARQAGGTPYTNRHYPGEAAMAFGPAALAEFAELIRADEREQSKVKSFAETYPYNPHHTCKCEHWEACDDCHLGCESSEAIRARKP